MAAVGVLVFAALLLPVVTDATSETAIYTNNGTPYKAFDDSAHTITVDTTDGIKITTDGELCANPDLSLYGSATLVYGERDIIRILSNGTLQIYGIVGGSTYGQYTISAGGEISTIELYADGTGKATGTNTYTFGAGATILAFISADPTSEYRLSLNPVVKEDSEIIGGGYTTISGFNYAVAFYGDIDNLTINNLWPSGNTFEVATVNTTALNPDLDKIDSIVFNVYHDNVLKGQATYTYFLAPASMEYDNPAYVGATMADMLGILPIVVICVLIFGVLGAALYTRIE